MNPVPPLAVTGTIRSRCSKIRCGIVISSRNIVRILSKRTSTTITIVMVIRVEEAERAIVDAVEVPITIIIDHSLKINRGVAGSA